MQNNPSKNTPQNTKSGVFSLKKFPICPKSHFFILFSLKKGAFSSIFLYIPRDVDFIPSVTDFTPSDANSHAPKHMLQLTFPLNDPSFARPTSLRDSPSRCDYGSRYWTSRPIKETKKEVAVQASLPPLLFISFTRLVRCV